MRWREKALGELLPENEKVLFLFSLFEEALARVFGKLTISHTA